MAVLHKHIEGDEQEAPKTTHNAREAAGDRLSAGILESKDRVAGEVDEYRKDEQVDWEGAAEPLAFIDVETEGVGVRCCEGVAEKVAVEVKVGGVDVGRSE